MAQTTSFNHILEMIDTLSLDEQDVLIDIMRHRQIEYKSHKTASLSDEEKEIAKKRFENHFGEIDSNNLSSIDNETIDADLAKEYFSNH